MMDKIIKFPYEITHYSKEENEELWDYLKGVKLLFNRVGPKGYVMPRGYNQELATNIYNFPLRSDDVFIASYPKSGTTWTQELTWLILNNLDFEKAKSVPLNDRYPFLEISIFLYPDKVDCKLKDVFLEAIMPVTVDQIEEVPSPRFIKTHLPLSLLPPTLLNKSKVVYVARDPRDVAVSFFHHYKLMRLMAPDRDFKTYWNYFINDKITWSPYFASVLEAWEKRNHPNMLFLFYEELSEDFPRVIRRVAKFFEKELSDEQVEKLREYLKFDNFKKNESVNMKILQDKGFFSSDGCFVRKGKVGGWREHFDEEMTVQAERWINKHLKGFQFYFSRVGPKGYVMTRNYNIDMATNIYNFPLRIDDTFIVTYPKSGTTWTQELVWLILNNLDYEKSNSLSLNERCPFLEFSIFINHEEVSDAQKALMPLTVDQIKELPSPRFIKTHMPISLLPQTLLDNNKVVYVARDPRDVAVSFFYHYKLMRLMAPDRDFKTYWNYFINDKISWSPYFASVLEAWEKRNHPNMLFLFYEELSEVKVIRRVAKFFNKHISDDQVAELREHLKFDNFKKNKSVNMEDEQEKGLFTSDGSFVRKGKSGCWREYFDEEMTIQAEQWIKKHLEGTDFKFPHLIQN